MNKTRTLGQHMLIDRKILKKIIEAANIGKDETVCEAGTGNGILCIELCKRAGQVISFEIDKALFDSALSNLHFSNLQLVNSDLFKMSVTFDVFVSNLPYSRSRDAFEWLAQQKFNRAVVTVQQEFAEKLLAKPRDKNYRAISAIAQHCFLMEKLFDVPRKSFEPRPSVESVVIRADQINTITKQIIKNINFIFSQRNKKASTFAAKVKVDLDLGDKRLDQLEIKEVVELARLMKNVPSFR